MNSNINILPALELIKEFEGFRSQVYLCPGNKCTIGYGTVVRNPETGRMLTGEDELETARLQYPSGVTELHATELLEKHVRSIAPRLACMITAHLTDNQFCALLDFAYNLGEGVFETSTLRKRINAGQFEDVPAQLRRFNKAGGKVLNGLARRREAEIALWLKE